ncbi:AIR carboxylase family protein [Patescibacteria group bacterium]
MIDTLIMVGSESDEAFLHEGLKYLQVNQVSHEVIITSTHRKPRETAEKIVDVMRNEGFRVAICGAATATGLPGVIAGYLRETNIPIFGVRFTKEPGQSIIEDATFNLSSMPSGVPLAYTGYNEKGFMNACVLAARITMSR